MSATRQVQNSLVTVMSGNPVAHNTLFSFSTTWLGLLFLAMWNSLETLGIFMKGSPVVLVTCVVFIDVMLNVIAFCTILKTDPTRELPYVLVLAAWNAIDIVFVFIKTNDLASLASIMFVRIVMDVAINVGIIMVAYRYPHNKSFIPWSENLTGVHERTASQVTDFFAIRPNTKVQYPQGTFTQTAEEVRMQTVPQEARMLQAVERMEAGSPPDADIGEVDEDFVSRYWEQVSKGKIVQSPTVNKWGAFKSAEPRMPIPVPEESGPIRKPSDLIPRTDEYIEFKPFPAEPKGQHGNKQTAATLNAEFENEHPMYAYEPKKGSAVFVDETAVTLNDIPETTVLGTNVYKDKLSNREFAIYMAAKRLEEAMRYWKNYTVSDELLEASYKDAVEGVSVVPQLHESLADLTRLVEQKRQNSNAAYQPITYLRVKEIVTNCEDKMW